ncbi:MAG: membrane protein insertion efficiency factor YidD [Calditerrivibrio sp.]|nr:membrane protein insertion efficiency factor YidD [Calditerrivibrio sp.]MCA1933567.1 membrane protein insertion efficiency factor YidD [Calditerrivibrio sp.]MCA1980460.1 membrane protein insertion efficiency factor YidD [Calditerrivibrio sp.]
MLKKLLKRSVIGLINFYQIAISPYLGQNCRFYPSCSAYAKEAIEKKGVIKGILLSIWRILRCNPFNKGGIDYVK